MDVGVGIRMHVDIWADIGEDEDTFPVFLLLFSFAFPYSMVFGCIRKNLHCCIQLSLDVCHSYRNYRNYFLGSVLLLILPAYFLDVQIYILYLFLHSNYKIVYRNILLGVFCHMFSCCCIHHFPLYFYTYFHVLVCISLQIYIYHYFPNMGIFLFSLSIGQLVLPFFVLCLVFLQIFSSDISLTPSGVVFSDSFVFLSF